MSLPPAVKTRRTLCEGAVPNVCMRRAGAALSQRDTGQKRPARAWTLVEKPGREERGRGSEVLAKSGDGSDGVLQVVPFFLSERPDLDLPAPATCPEPPVPFLTPCILCPLCRQLSSCPVLLGLPRPLRAQSAVGGQRAQQTLPQHGEGAREELGPLGGGRPFIAGLSCSHAPAFAPRDTVKAFGL